MIYIKSAIAEPAGDSHKINADVRVGGSATQSLSIYCSADKKHCSYLGIGHYPARWLDGNHGLEILGVANNAGKWEKTEYTIAARDQSSSVPVSP